MMTRKQAQPSCSTITNPSLVFCYNLLAFGNPALQRYAEMLEDQESGLLFQTVSNSPNPQYKMHLLHMHSNARSVDGREMPLMTVISESLRFISDKALTKLRE